MPAHFGWAALGCCAMLAACNGGLADPGRPVATVNGRTVSEGRLAAALERSGGRAPELVLESVIDQELLVQAAIARGLDRDPKVRQAIEDARRQTLAHAYLQALPGATPGPEEARDFYERNPALFAQRRIFRLRELSFDAEAPAGLEQRVSAARNLEALSAWLKTQGVASRILAETRPSEELPLVFLSRIASMQPGEIALLGASGSRSILQLLGSEEAPLSEAEALPVIERFLSSRRRIERAEREIARLRGGARIHYVGGPGARPAAGVARRASAELLLARVPVKDSTTVRGLH